MDEKLITAGAASGVKFIHFANMNMFHGKEMSYIGSRCCTLDAANCCFDQLIILRLLQHR